MPADWPFADPENVAVFTLNRIVRGESPILRVMHDEEDGGWQFLDNDEVAIEEASLVCLREIARLDPSILELADLPLGWVAERVGPGEPWQRAPAVTEEDRERKLVSDIEEVGWHVIMVSEDDKEPSFAYSIGLFRTFDHPEIVVFGLDLEVMHRIINLIGEEVRQGRRFADGQAASGILEGYDIRFLNVAGRHYLEHFGYAHWYYKGDDFPALQCLWPDNQGRFPMDADYAERLRVSVLRVGKRLRGDPAVGPERIPLSLLTQEQGSQMADRIGPLVAPPHPRALHSPADDRLTRRLHRARADLPPLGPIARIVHPMALVAEVGHHPLPCRPRRGFPARSRPSSQARIAGPPSCFSRCDHAAWAASAAAASPGCQALAKSPRCSLAW